jgi:hypothetical protein
MDMSSLQMHQEMRDGRQVVEDDSQVEIQDFILVGQVYHLSQPEHSMRQDEMLVFEILIHSQNSL